jgi:hypothetical protein
MYRFFRQGWWLALLCMTVLAACAPQTASQESPQLACDSIFSPELLALNLDDVPEEALQTWVSEHHGERGLISSSRLFSRQWEEVVVGNTTTLRERPDAEAIRIEALSENIIEERGSEGSRYEWMWEGQLYTASYHDEQERLLTIDIEFNPEPTLADVERCYGTPESYKIAFYTHDYEWVIPYLWSKPTYSSSFTLYYPEQGLTFFDYREGDGHSIPTVDMNTPVRTGSVLRAGSVLDLMNDGVPGFTHEETDATPFTTWEAFQY